MLFNTILLTLFTSLAYYSYQNIHIFDIKIPHVIINNWNTNVEIDTTTICNFKFIRGNSFTDNKLYHMSSKDYRMIRERYIDNRHDPEIIKYNSISEYLWLLFLCWFLKLCFYIESFFVKS